VAVGEWRLRLCHAGNQRTFASLLTSALFRSCLTCDLICRRQGSLVLDCKIITLCFVVGRIRYLGIDFLLKERLGAEGFPFRFYLDDFLRID